MAEREEGPGGGAPVHYQISITGRQAGAFVFTLLLALGLAYFFGMKTGAAARRGPDVVTRLAAASDLPVPTPVDAEERNTEPPRDTKPAPAPPDDRKLGFETTPAPAEPTKSQPPAPKATKEVPTPLPTAVPATPVPSPAADARAGPTPKPKKEAPFFVQVLATKSASTADEQAKRLRKAGFKADVSVVPEKPGFFRVRVGPYADRAKAEAAAKKVQAADRTIKHRPIVVE